MAEKHFFYRWVILAGGFLLMAVPFSIVNTIHTLFITPVTQARGFSISGFSLIFTIGAVTQALVSPLVGKLLERLRARWVMTFGALCVSAGFACYGAATALWMFYAIGIVIAVGMTALTTIPISTLITRWFGEQRGMAMGIAFAGAGTGTFFWMQIVSRLLHTYGYAATYGMLGALIGAVALPIALFGMVGSPQEKYGGSQAPRQARTQGAQMRAQADRRLFSDKAFLFFTAGVFFMGVAVAGVQIHVQPYLASLGYDLFYNANIGSVLAAAALSGSVIGGVVFDRFQTRTALLIFGACALASLVLLIFAQWPGVPYAFAVVFGLCLCLPSLWPPYGSGKLAGGERYAATLGLVNLFFVFGGAVGPFFSGLMADSALGYRAAWTLYFVLTALYLFLFLQSLRCMAEKDGTSS